MNFHLYGNENMYVVIFGVVSYHLRPKITKAMEANEKMYVQLIKNLWKPKPEDRPSAQEVMIKLRSLRKRKTSMNNPSEICCN